MIFATFTSAYVVLCQRLMYAPDHVSRPRGMETRELEAVQFEVADAGDLALRVPARRWSAPYFAGEVAWYLSGSDRLADIAPYSRFWESVSDDGVTVNSAYGHRIFGGDVAPWDAVAHCLSQDPDSRRGIIMIARSTDDLIASKDVPCTLSLQFLRRAGALDLIATMRSTDIVFGLSYDVPFFLLLQHLMASLLHLPVGRYVHQSASLHVYARHYAMLEAICRTGESVAATYDGAALRFAAPQHDPRQIAEFLRRERAVRTTGLYPPGPFPTLRGFWAQAWDVLDAHWLRKHTPAPALGEEPTDG